MTALLKLQPHRLLYISSNAIKHASSGLPGSSAPRYLHSSAHHFEKALPPRPVIPESDLEEHFLKGSGPGGQKINKTSSAVQLKHLPTGIVVKSQATRSRSQNRKYARQLLAEKLDVIAKGDQSRTAIKQAVKKKKKASAEKKKRRKYRALEEAKNGAAVGEDGELEEEEDSGEEDEEDEEFVEGEHGQDSIEQPNDKSR